MINVTLPSSLPTRFDSRIEYTDSEKNVTDSVQLMYDEQNHVVVFNVDFDRDLDMPYVQNTVVEKLKGRARVFQDFNSGIF